MHVTRNRILLPALLALFFSTGVPSALAHDHEHSHEEGAPQRLALKDGNKWATDDTLRKTMSAIRADMEASQSFLSEDKISLQQFQELSRKVNEQIAFMVRNCKLDKEADAMLHLVLADIIAGTDELAGQGIETARRGAEKISRALESYGAYFDHPGWH